MGSGGAITMPDQGVIEGYVGSGIRYRLESRGVHLNAATGTEIEWFADGDLGNNSKSVAYIKANGDGANNNELVLRTAGSNSNILMTTSYVDFNNADLRGAGVMQYNTSQRNISGSTTSIGSITTTVVKVNASSNATIRTLNVSGGNRDGMMLIIVNNSVASSLYFSSAGGNIRTQAQDTVRVYEGSWTAFVYDGRDNLWNLMTDVT